MSSSQDTGRQVKEVNYSYSLARPRISQSEPEYSGDAVQVLALPPHSSAPVCRVIPIAAGARMQSRAVLLHDDASCDVLEGGVHRGEPLHGILDHQTAPLVHLKILESDCDLSAFRIQNN